MIDVAVGGGLALVAAFIVPSRERPRLADAIDGVLDALARYVELAAGGGGSGERGGDRDREQVVAMRRELGLALEGAEASLERMLAEPPPLRHGAERAMYVVTYARRLSASITELLEGGGSVPADVAAYLAKAIEAARGRDGDGAPATTTLPAPTATATATATTTTTTTTAPAAMELLVRRGELLAQTASIEARPDA